MDLDRIYFAPYKLYLSGKIICLKSYFCALQGKQLAIYEQILLVGEVATLICNIRIYNLIDNIL